MNNLVKLITLGSAMSATLLSANTVLLKDVTDFSLDGPWFTGTNQFGPSGWTGFATLEAPDRVTINGDGTFTFSSWDDDESERLENFLFQEFGAGPAILPDENMHNTLFSTGDIIVFKGEASATRVGADTSDMTVRAFIKFLGFIDNNSHQTKFQETFNITSDNEAFELMATFPDLEEDDSYQLVQIGFEISTNFDGSNMDSGTIIFSNLEGYIEGEGNGGTEPGDETWAGIEVDGQGNVDTGDFLGLVHVTDASWVYLFSMSRWAYIPDPGADAAGAWSFMLNTGN